MTTLATRRSMLGAFAALPVTGLALQPTFNRDILTRLNPMSHEALFAELDAIDLATARIDSGATSQPEWDAWEEWTDRVWDHIERLPATPENAKIKARAVWSIINGEATEINEGQSTVCRLVQHVMTGLNRGGC